MELNMEKELMFMPIKIATLAGGCLAKNMDRELILTMTLVPNLSDNGPKINL